MSRFSGRVDFADLIDEVGFEKIARASVYSEAQEQFIEFKQLKDCIPFYPCKVKSYEEVGDNIFIHLKQSWIKLEKELYGSLTRQDFYKEELKKELQKAERKEAPYEDSVN